MLMIFQYLWDKEFIFGPDLAVNEKNISLVREFFEKAWEKINHFDMLRQQLLNYALIAFSGLLAFIINTDNTQMQYTGCCGIVLLMVVFCLRDHRFHKYTHGFSAAAILQAQALRDLINEPNKKVTIRIYRSDAERYAVWWKSHHTRIYCLMIIAALILSVILYVY